MTIDSILYCNREMPKFHPFLENTYTISEGGLDAVEELALGFIEIRYIVRHLMARGLSVDTFAPRIALLVNCHMDFFETIAKIRAARRMYARMMRDEFGAKDPRSTAINIASHTSGLSMTAPQPVNNVVRGTSEAMRWRWPACRRWRSRPSTRPTGRPAPKRTWWACARSRSSSSRPASPRCSTRSAARTSSRR